MYVCMCIGIFVCYVYLHVCFVYIYMYICICVCVYIYVCLCVCIMYIYVHMCICICVYVYYWGGDVRMHACALVDFLMMQLPPRPQCSCTQPQQPHWSTSWMNSFSSLLSATCLQ